MFHRKHQRLYVQKPIPPGAMTSGKPYFLFVCLFFQCRSARSFILCRSTPHHDHLWRIPQIRSLWGPFSKGWIPGPRKSFKLMPLFLIQAVTGRAIDCFLGVRRHGEIFLSVIIMLAKLHCKAPVISCR